MKLCHYDGLGIFLHAIYASMQCTSEPIAYKLSALQQPPALRVVWPGTIPGLRLDAVGSSGGRDTGGASGLPMTGANPRVPPAAINRVSYTVMQRLLVQSAERRALCSVCMHLASAPGPIAPSTFVISSTRLCTQPHVSEPWLIVCTCSNFVTLLCCRYLCVLQYILPPVAPPRRARGRAQADGGRGSAAGSGGAAEEQHARGRGDARGRGGAQQVASRSAARSGGQQPTEEGVAGREQLLDDEDCASSSGDEGELQPPAPVNPGTDGCPLGHLAEVAAAEHAQALLNATRHADGEGAQAAAAGPGLRRSGRKRRQPANTLEADPDDYVMGDEEDQQRVNQALTESTAAAAAAAANTAAKGQQAAKKRGGFTPQPLVV